MLKTLGLILLYCVSLSANADTFQSLDTLSLLVEKFVTENIETNDGKLHVDIGKIDNRLKLKACPLQQLKVSNPSNTPLINTNTLLVTCQLPESNWSIYMPITISLTQPVITAKHVINKNTILTEDDLTLTEMDIRKLKQGYVQNTATLIGKKSNIMIQQGNPVDPNMLAMPKVVLKGESVTIKAVSNQLQVSMSGVALEDGAIGDSIRVKNNSSKRIIQAEITGKKQVTVEI